MSLRDDINREGINYELWEIYFSKFKLKSLCQARSASEEDDIQAATIPQFSSLIEEDIFGKLMLTIALSIPHTNTAISDAYQHLSASKYQDRERLLKILGILSKIDPKTPIGRDIIKLINEIPEERNDYVSILRYIQGILPSCNIRQDEIDLTPISVQLSLNDLLKKNKAAILAEIRPNQKEKFEEILNGDNPEKDLLKILQSIPEGFIGQIAITQIINFINRLFKQGSEQKITNLSKDSKDKSNLILLFQKLEPQALKTQIITDFLAAYTDAETKYSLLFEKLKNLQTTWPLSFKVFISQLNDIIDENPTLNLDEVNIRLEQIHDFYQGHELNLMHITMYLKSSKTDLLFHINAVTPVNTV